jgi:hypothetical protein
VARQPAVIPALKDCPDCGLGIQKGRNPHGLAFHECRPRAPVNARIRRMLEGEGPLDEATVRDVALRAALSAIVEKPDSSSALLDLYRTLKTETGGGKGAGAAAPAAAPESLLSWFTVGSPVDEDDEG